MYEPELNPNKIWPTLEKALKKALGEFEQMRIKEGNTIAVQIKKPLNDIEKCLKVIKGLLPDIVKHLEKRLLSRLKEVSIDIHLRGISNI